MDKKKWSVRDLFRIVLKLYFILCGIIVPLILIAVIYLVYFSEKQVPPSEAHKDFEELVSIYEGYWAIEYPKRDEVFELLVLRVNEFYRLGREKRAIDSNMISLYLGKPDSECTDGNSSTLIYNLTDKSIIF